MTRLARAALPLWLFVPAVAHADLIDPREDACRSSEEGDACDLDNGAKGKCAKAKCHRNDYSGGPPPKSVSVDCLKCVESPDGAAADSATPADRAEDDDVAEDAEDDRPDVKADPRKPEAAPPAEAKAEPEAKPAEASKDAAKDAGSKDEKGGCTAGAPVSMTSVALGLVILLGLGRGRRAR